MDRLTHAQLQMWLAALRPFVKTHQEMVEALGGRGNDTLQIPIGRTGRIRLTLGDFRRLRDLAKELEAQKQRIVRGGGLMTREGRYRRP